MRQDLNRLLWDVRVEASTVDALFGGKATITVTVTDRNADPVQGATVSFTTDWGSLTSSIAVTDANGKVSVELVGVQTETPVRLADVGILQRVSQKVAAATLANPGAVEYAKVRFEPEELAMVSRYSPPGLLHDLGTDLPAGADRRAARPAHRDGHGAREGEPGRDRARRRQRPGPLRRLDPRLGADEDRRRHEAGHRRRPDRRRDAAGLRGRRVRPRPVVTGRLPFTLQSIHDETQSKLKEHLFVDPQLDDADVVGSGLLGQVIAQEATAAVGARTNTAIETQLDQFVAATDVPLDARQAATARTDIVQRSSQITAGFAQSHKQLFSVARTGG